MNKNENNINLFVYGELLKEEILLNLIKRIPLMENAKIVGYEKFFDEKIGYYGVRKKENSIVNGKILFNISNEELKIFDDFEDEGVYYFRKPAKIHCENKIYDGYVYLRTANAKINNNYKL